MFVLEDLVIRLGMDVYSGGKPCVGLCSLERGMKVKEVKALVQENLIEVDEKAPLLFIDGTEIILQILEERRVEVTRL